MKHVIQKHVHVICAGVVQLGSPAAAAIAPQTIANKLWFVYVGNNKLDPHPLM